MPQSASWAVQILDNLANPVRLKQLELIFSLLSTISVDNMRGSKHIAGDEQKNPRPSFEEPGWVVWLVVRPIPRFLPHPQPDVSSSGFSTSMSR